MMASNWRVKPVKVIDDWHVVGLAGTGSKSFEVSNLFVPDHRLLGKQASDEGRAAGALFHSAPATRLLRGGVLAVTYTAVVVGVAQGLLEEFLRITGPRRYRGNPVAMQVAIQASIGQAAAEIEATERMYLGAIRETMEVLSRGGGRSATSSIFKANAMLLYGDGLLQRMFRDCFGAAAHYSLVWESAAADYGKHALNRAV